MYGTIYHSIEERVGKHMRIKNKSTNSLTSSRKEHRGNRPAQKSCLKGGIVTVVVLLLAALLLVFSCSSCCEGDYSDLESIVWRWLLKSDVEYGEFQPVVCGSFSVSKTGTLSVVADVIICSRPNNER